MSRHNVGAAPTLTATFKNRLGQLADPDTVTFSYRDPLGVLTQHTWTLAVPGTDIVRVSTGVFLSQVPLTIAGGAYAWHWLGEGAVPAAAESDVDTALYTETTGF